MQHQLSCEQVIALLTFYTEDKLSKKLAQYVQEHLEICPECMEKYKHLKQILNLRNVKLWRKSLMLGESIQRFDFLWLTCAKNSKPMKKSLIITGLLLLAGCSLFDSEDLILRKRRDETGSWMGSGPKKERNHDELIPGDTTVYVSTDEEGYSCTPLRVGFVICGPFVARLGGFFSIAIRGFV